MRIEKYLRMQACKILMGSAARFLLHLLLPFLGPLAIGGRLSFQSSSLAVEKLSI